jgi:hypothetical protein
MDKLLYPLTSNFFKIPASESNVRVGGVDMGGKGGLKPLNGIYLCQIFSLE